MLWPLAFAFVAALAASCAAEDPPPAPPETPEPAVPHGDHNPHHGGVVMMNGDVHYEVVLNPDGTHQLYFTDATRADLPASAATDASLTIVRKAEPPETVTLRIDEAGESWIGQGKPVKDGATTTVRVAYTLRGEPSYWIDLPFEPGPAAPNAPDPHKKLPPS